MAIRWTKALSIGIQDIDAQHRELIRRIKAFRAGLNKRSRQDVGILLSYLRLYAVAHFGEEELAMRSARYPGYRHHKEQHDTFMKDLLAMSEKQQKARGSGVAAQGLAAWLESWLVEHVRDVDREMARFFLARDRKGAWPPPARRHRRPAARGRP
jgi:hemerythrin